MHRAPSTFIASQNVAKASDLKTQLLEAQLAQQEAVANEASLRHQQAVDDLKASQESQADLLVKCRQQIDTSLQWQQTGKRPCKRISVHLD